MKFWGLNEVREQYLSFFEKKGHLRLPSFSLVPQNDPSILLINAGMTPMKPFFTGAETPPSVRITSCQKCIRTIDIDNVGMSARHGTFFEMLGNFSFGDYFKEEMIPWAWELCTEVFGMDPARLYPSVYEEDDEAESIWLSCKGVIPSHIKRLGRDTNFWEHGVGPCGPCSEIYYDMGAAFGCDSSTCDVGCDCDRYVEIWNLVFTLLYHENDGTYTQLKQRNIDTGGGLERFAAVLQGASSIFEVDTIKAILDRVCEISGVKYGAEHASDCALRIITDHIRSASMMIADGVRPANEGRGYVLKRLLRRAARYGRLLGLTDNFLADVASVVIAQSGGAYPELIQRQTVILQVIDDEETRFLRTLNQGLSLLEETFALAKQNGESALAGETVFKLHDTFGFPYDLTRELASEQGLLIDEAGFNLAMKTQKENARQALKHKGETAWGGNALPQEAKTLAATRFVGYDTLNFVASPQLLIKSTGDNTMESVATLSTGEIGLVIADTTPFYAEGGGQTADNGTISNQNGSAQVSNVTKTAQGVFLHEIEVIDGEINLTESYQFAVDWARRGDIERNHTATHLLHKALRHQLGEHVEQAGSLVTNEGLRFDFSHGKPLTQDQIDAVEQEINDVIQQGLEVKTDLMSQVEAKHAGAMALFGEKYGDVVRVLTVPNYSVELCGGTHVKNTAFIRLFTLTSEGGIAAGVRRIEAITGRNAVAHGQTERRLLQKISGRIKAQPLEIEAKIEQLQKELKQVQREVVMLNQKSVADQAKTWQPVVLPQSKVKLVFEKIDGVDIDLLRNLGDSLKERHQNCVVLLGSVLASDKVLWLAMCSDDVVKAGVKAGDVIREAASMSGGGGGGRPDMAQAGGKDATKVEQILQIIMADVTAKLEAE